MVTLGHSIEALQQVWHSSEAVWAFMKENFEKITKNSIVFNVTLEFSALVEGNETNYEVPNAKTYYVLDCVDDK